MTDSSRYTPTCSLTPGWSRTIWPAEAPRMATWLWPGPRFCTLNDATVRDLAIDPTDPRVVVAALQGGGVWRTADAGASWQQLASYLPRVLSVKAVERATQ